MSRHAALVFVAVARVAGCTPSANEHHGAPAPAVAPSAAPTAPLPTASATTTAAVPTAIARWTQSADAGDAWTRSAGDRAPPLVLRGVLRPSQPTDIAMCP